MKSSDNAKLLKKIDRLESEIRSLKNSLFEKNWQLDVIYNSKTWRLGQLYARFFGLDSWWRKLLSNCWSSLGFHKSDKEFSNAKIRFLKVQDLHYRQVFEFLDEGRTSKGLFITIGGPYMRYQDRPKGVMETHRAIKMTREFSQAGYKIIYLYFASWGMAQLDHIGQVDENIIEMNINLFFLIYKQVMKKCTLRYDTKILLIQELHPVVPEILAHANAGSWRTVYDILDNWQEFAKSGWMKKWYSWELEEFVINNSDVRVAVSWFIRDKFSGYNNLYLVHNGYSHCKNKNIEVALPKGEVTIGYIGNLESYRFDWDLLFSIAKKRRQWRFYLIGKLPKNIKVTKNIVSLGVVEPDDLHAYACNWDVGIVPFKVNNLTVSCDNIKVYEYLSFGLPVVAKGIGEHMKEYPHVFIAKDEKEFEKLMTKATNESFPEKRIEDFLKSAAWENRSRQMLNCIFKSTITYKDYLFENSVYS